MWRLFILIGIVLLAAFAAVWVADRPGDVTIRLPGYEFETSVAVAAAAVVALAAAIIAVWSVLRFIFRLPDIATLTLRSRKRSKGFAAVSRGLVAVGSGDARAAQRAASEAEKLIGLEPMTLLLKAQAAQLSGDRPAAEGAFTRMLEQPETRVLGLRGLYVEARRRGDDAAARRHAEQATRLQPSMPWANEALLGFHCEAQDWAGAIAALDRSAALGLLSKPDAKRQKAALLTARARELELTDPAASKAAALEALKLDPRLSPAAGVAARLLSASGDLRKAAKIIEATWKSSPHPELAALYAHLRAGDSARDKFERVRKLTAMMPDHEESRVALARAAHGARDFTAGREALSPLIEAGPTARVCVLMAAIEESEHGAMGKVREWLSRATRASRDPAWMADGAVSDVWAPVSPVNGKIGAWEWGRPPAMIAAAEPRDDVLFDLDEPALANIEPPALVGSPSGDVTTISHEAPSPETATAHEARAGDVTTALQTESMADDTAVPGKPALSVAAEPMPENVAVLNAAHTRPAAAASDPTRAAPREAALQTAATHLTATAPSKTSAPSTTEVIFPVGRAPDDPGPDETGADTPARRKFKVFG